MVLHGLDSWLSVQHEGRIIAAQEAPPSRAFQRTITGSSPYIARRGLSELTISGTAILPKLATEQFEGNAYGVIANMESQTLRLYLILQGSRRWKPTFLQRERWKAIQKAKRKGLSIRGITREVGDQPSHGEEIHGR